MILLDSGAHPGILQKIVQVDYWLFARINQEWTHPSLDTLFVFLREAELWVPFYLFLLVFITLNFRLKGLWWSLSLIMTAIISDLVSSHLIKHLIFRLRPCQNPALAGDMRVLASYCPTSSSFTSSHACTHFALAFFLFLTLRSTSRWWWLVFPWAFLIAYAQVYVGVHFPLDVFCGAVIGSGIGLATSRLFRWQFGTLHSQIYKSSHA
jgi:membrane-associated phospholipid phosphatase